MGDSQGEMPTNTDCGWVLTVVDSYNNGMPNLMKDVMSSQGKHDNDRVYVGKKLETGRNNNVFDETEHSSCGFHIHYSTGWF